MATENNRRYIVIGVCFVLFALLFTVIGIHNLNADMSKAEAELSSITSSNEKSREELDALRNAYQGKLAAASASNIGTNTDKITRDVRFITELIKPAYSWESDSDYNEARSAIEAQIGSNNTFMSNVLPSLEDEHISLDAQDLNMKCMRIDVFPGKTVKGKATYYALVEYIQYFKDDIKKQDHLTRNRQVLYVVMESANKVKSIDAVNAEDVRTYDTGNNG